MAWRWCSWSTSISSSRDFWRRRGELIKIKAYNFLGLFNAGFQLWHIPLGLIVKCQFDVMFAQDGQRMLDGELALAKALAGEPLRRHIARLAVKAVRAAPRERKGDVEVVKRDVDMGSWRGLGPNFRQQQKQQQKLRNAVGDATRPQYGLQRLQIRMGDQGGAGETCYEIFGMTPMVWGEKIDGKVSRARWRRQV